MHLLNEFTTQYVTENSNQEFVCKSCGMYLNLKKYAGWTPVELIGGVKFPAIGELPYFLTTGPHGFYWFRLHPPIAVSENVTTSEKAPSH